MGIFFNRKKDLDKKKIQEEKIIDNAYTLKNFKLRFSKTGSSIEVQQRDYIRCNTVFYIDCDKDYSFGVNWEDDSYTYKRKFTPKNGRIKLSYNIFPNGMKKVDLRVVTYDKDGDSYEMHLGDPKNWKKNIEDQFYMPTETRMLIFKIIDKINFTNDVNFARRFVANPEEFERMLKHINNPEANIKPQTNSVNAPSQTSANKALLESKKKELLSANTSKKTTVPNNVVSDPLGEYIARQEKQKRK